MGSNQMAKKKTGIEKLYVAQPKGNNADGKGDDALLKKARERARDGQTYWKDNWDAAEDDLKFLSGEQWPSQVRTERELEQRPCLTNNVLPTFVDQVLGDQRQNKPSIKINASEPILVPDTEGGEMQTLKISNQSGKKDYEIAEVYQGLIRNIEYNCNAEDAYDFSFQASVESGIGYLRVLSDYLHDETFEQELCIKNIENQFAVTIDPSAKEFLKEDMGWCLVDDWMDKEKFQEKYPDAQAEPLDNQEEYLGSWFSEKMVRVSEYFTRIPVIKELALLSDGRSMWLEDIEGIVDELLEVGVSIVRTRKVKTYKVLWRKITAFNVLEGPVELPCTTIPIVPVWGKSITIKKRKIYRGVIRHSKDAQRMSNYWDSAATETVALAPKAKFKGTPEHFEGFEDEWKTANTSNQAMLPYNPQTPNDPGPQQMAPPLPPSAEITLGLSAVDKIKSTLGMFDASIGARGNETSGRAILARQREADVGTFAFIDNLSKSIRRVGQLLVEMIPATYDTERVIRIKFPDDTEDFVKINEQIYDDESKEWVTINDLGVGKYDVVVSTGPAYTTQRMEAAESMIAFAQAVPAAAGVMADLMAQNMDWPGADVIAERLKKIVPPNVLTAEEREKLTEDLPEQTEPSPEQLLAAKELDVKNKQADADMMEAEADMAQAGAKTAQAEADMLEAQLKGAQAQAAMGAIEAGAEAGNIAYQQVREMVAQAIAELMENRPTQG